jgi:hypothetical protein
MKQENFICELSPHLQQILYNYLYHKLLSVIAPASYAQFHMWHDDQIRFHSDQPQMAIHNMPFLYRLSLSHTLSVNQLQQALFQVIIKHSSLRTSLVFNKAQNLLMQKVINTKNNNNKLFSFIESTFDTDEQLNNITHDEYRNNQHFDPAQGLVFRCHILYYKQISLNNMLSDKDAIIFNFHHAFFDLSSINLFLHDLDQAYTTNKLTNDNNTILRYLDCEYKYIWFSIQSTSLLSFHF